MRKYGNEKGSMLVIALFGVMSLILAMAVAIDLARLWRLHHFAQGVADSSAVAGAQYLPDTIQARMITENYIRQRVSTYFGNFDTQASAYGDTEDVMVSTWNRYDTNSAQWVTQGGTVAVVVRALFDPLFTPRYLYGNYSTQGIFANAVAVGGWHAETYAIIVDPSDIPPGKYALFVGGNANFNNPPGANNFDLCGGDPAAQINGTLTGGTNPNSEATGEISVGETSTLTGQNPAQFPVSDHQETNVMPNLLESAIAVDATVPPWGGYYNATAKPLLLSDGSTVPDIQVTYDGSSYTFAQSGDVTAADINNATFGNALDIKVKDDLIWGTSSANKRYAGMIWVQGDLSFPSPGTNGLQISEPTAAVQGKDNNGLACYIDSDAANTPQDLHIDGQQVGFNGLVYVTGTTYLDGNQNSSGNCVDANACDPTAAQRPAFNGALWTNGLELGANGPAQNISICFDPNVIKDAPIDPNYPFPIPASVEGHLVQ